MDVQRFSSNDHRDNTRALEVHSDLQAPGSSCQTWEMPEPNELNGGLYLKKPGLGHLSRNGRFFHINDKRILFLLREIG